MHANGKRKADRIRARPFCQIVDVIRWKPARPECYRASTHGPGFSKSGLSNQTPATGIFLLFYGKMTGFEYSVISTIDSKIHIYGVTGFKYKLLVHCVLYRKTVQIRSEWFRESYNLTQVNFSQTDAQRSCDGDICFFFSLDGIIYPLTRWSMELVILRRKVLTYIADILTLIFQI